MPLVWQTVPVFLIAAHIVEPVDVFDPILEIMARASAGLVADVAAEASPAYSALSLAVPGGFDLTSIGGTSIREREYSAWQTFNKFGPPPIFDGYVCVLRGFELFSPLVGQRLRSASSIQPKPLLGQLNMLWS
jgi:hypothetical protein